MPEFATVLLCVLAVQFGVQAHLTNLFRDPLVDVGSLILVQEAIKIVICVVMLMLVGTNQDNNNKKPPKNTTATGKNRTPRWTLSDSLQRAAVPAGLYVVQNFCVQRAYLMLDELTFTLLNQSKILFAALFLYLVMNRRQSMVQVVALVLLFVSAALLSLDSVSNDTNETDGEVERVSGDWSGKVVGSGLALAAACISGLSGTLTQYALQVKSVSSFVFSLELSMYGIIALVTHRAVSHALGADATVEDLLPGGEHWQLATFIPLITNGMGGICVGLVTKYAGSVKKGIAIVGGILISSLIRVASDDGGTMSMNVLVSVPLVVVATYLHSAYPPAPKRKKD